MGRRLVVIGNGFDQHHGIASSYRAFGDYLAAKDSETFQLVEEYFVVDDSFWWEFEERLASFDGDTLIENASDFLMPYSTEDWSDAYHHDFQYEIQRVVTAISHTMRSHFADWIRQLGIPDPAGLGPLRVRIDPKATFLNFNYTQSLELLYDVPRANILYIHGCAGDPAAKLVLGHGWNPGQPDPYRFEREPSEADIRRIEGIGIVDDYFKDTFKPSADIIRQNQAFFDDLQDVDEIFVMGHSLAAVDHPYFDALLSRIDLVRSRWTISYYRDVADAEAAFAMLGVTPLSVDFRQLSAF